MEQLSRDWNAPGVSICRRRRLADIPRLCSNLQVGSSRNLNTDFVRSRATRRVIAQVILLRELSPDRRDGLGHGSGLTHIDHAASAVPSQGINGVFIDVNSGPDSNKVNEDARPLSRLFDLAETRVAAVVVAVGENDQRLTRLLAISN